MYVTPDNVSVNVDAISRNTTTIWQMGKFSPLSRVRIQHDTGKILFTYIYQYVFTEFVHVNCDFCMHATLKL